MNLKNNLMVLTSFFGGYALYFYYFCVVKSVPFLEVIGSCLIMNFVTGILYQIYLEVQRKITPKYKNEWAIITGCTSGLGYSMALKFAEQGFNLVLIGRNETLLNDLVKNLDTFKIKTHLIVHDFNSGEFEVLKKNLYTCIFEDCAISQKQIGVLVNNVGIALDDLTHFDDYPIEKDFSMIDVNVKSILGMTKIVLPLMKSQAYGYIVNVGSASCLNAGPYMATYSATKSFIDEYTRGMALEYEQCGIHFHVSYPAFFVSGMTNVEQTIFIPHSDTIADGIMRHMKTSTASIPYFVHYIQMLFPKYHWFEGISAIVLKDIYNNKKYREEKRKNAKKIE